jgi:hydrogenase maturation factor
MRTEQYGFAPPTTPCRLVAKSTRALTVEPTASPRDATQGHPLRPVWHEWAKKDLTRSDVEHSEVPIHNAVRSVLSTFPPAT